LNDQWYPVNGARNWLRYVTLVAAIALERIIELKLLNC